MNESKETKLSARSKVMDSWNSGWKSISKTPPVMPPVVDIQLNRSLKLKKSDKKVRNDFNKNYDPTKVITKENQIKLLTKNIKRIETNKQKDTNPKNDSSKDISNSSSKDKSKDNCIDKAKELRYRMNGRPIDNNMNDSVEVTINQKSSPEKVVSNESQSKTANNSILSKLRKRKNGSRVSSIDTQSNETLVSEPLCDPHCDKSLNELENKNKDSTEEKVKTAEKGLEEEEEAPNTLEIDVQPMEVDSLMKTCLRPDCYKKINRFFLFEDKYCSSECAIKQWTEDFQSYWTLKKTL